MNMLADSSEWVGHFKRRNNHLVALLEGDAVICHLYVVAEIACETSPCRKSIIGMLAELKSAPVATHDKLLAMLDTLQLRGRGCGLVDMGLLASTLLTETALIWTADKRLELLASEWHRAYRSALRS